MFSFVVDFDNCTEGLIYFNDFDLKKNKEKHKKIITCKVHIKLYEMLS